MLRFVHLATLLVALTTSARAGESFTNRLAQLQKQLALQPTNVALLIQLGDFCHDEGVNDNAKAVVLADRYFRDALKLEPTNALALALLGSTYTMKGRDAFWPGTKLSLVNEG